MSNILLLPQVPAFAYTVSVDGDWLDSIFFPADTATPPTPLDLTGIRFRADFRSANTSQIILAMDTATNTLVNQGAAGFLSFQLLAATRRPIFPVICTADLFAIADGYQINLSDESGPLQLTIKSDTL